MNDIRSSFRTRSRFLGAAGFVALLVTLVLLDDFFLGWTQAGHLVWMHTRELHPERIGLAWITFAGTLIVLTLYLWAMLRAARPVRVALWLFFSIAVMIEYGYWKVVGRPMTPVDFWTAALSPSSLWVSAIQMYFNWTALIVVALAALAIIGSWPLEAARRRPAVILAGALLAVVLWRTFGPYDPVMGGSLLKFTQMLGQLRLSDVQKSVREKLPEIQAPRPSNNIILIVDESVRGDHLSVNGYTRSTTPYLDQLSRQPDFYNWGPAVSSATCSIFSNRFLITGIHPEPGSQERGLQWPTIYQYARAMGYRVYYLDGQMDKLWTGLTTNDLAYIDERLTIDDFQADAQTDRRMAEFVHRSVQASTGNFFVINKRGVHFHYEDNYPESAKQWGPTPPGMDYETYPELVVNAYDNALRYNLEAFFQALVPDLKPVKDTYILYTSDHGETVQEHGERWSHCNNTPIEATIPLILIGRLETAPDVSYLAGHSNILPTLLDLMGVPVTARLHPYSPSLLTATAADNQARYYFDGELNLVQFDP